MPRVAIIEVKTQRWSPIINVPVEEESGPRLNIRKDVFP